MKRNLLIHSTAGVTIALCVAFGQTPPVIESSTTARQPHVARTPQQLLTDRLNIMIRSKKPLMTLKVPLLNRMGDASATNIIDMLRDRGPLTQMEQRNVVDMIHIAFEEPASIMHHSDRTPISSLILLSQIGEIAHDPVLQTRLAETRQFVMDAKAGRSANQ